MSDEGTKPRTSFILTIVAIIGMLVAGGLIGAQYQKAILDNPSTRIDIAIKAFRSGADGVALKILQPLADTGNARALYWLGDIYEHGLGVPKNIPHAIKLLEQAANAGIRPAKSRLGAIYFHGDKTIQDFTKAAKWLKAAALSGDGRSAFYLGQIYTSGLGVKKDLAEAYAWYEMGTQLKDGGARALRDQLLKLMTPGEISKGEQRATALHAQVTIEVPGNKAPSPTKD